MSLTKKWQFVKYEDCIESEQLYAITLNPEDSHQYWNSDNRIIEFNKYHKNYLQKHLLRGNNNVFHMELRLEVSPQGRLHYHGILQIYRKLDFYIYVLHKLQMIYMYEIDTIKDLKVWGEYMSKQNLTQIIIGHNFKKLTKDFFSNYKDDDHGRGVKVPHVSEESRSPQDPDN